VKAHNYDRDESPTIRVFNLFAAHLLKVRGRPDGTLMDMMELFGNRI
jgi:hypothetical protein